MKVTRIWQVVEIRIIPGEPCDCSRIRHQVAPSLALQNDSNARLHRAARAPYARNIYSTLLQGAVRCLRNCRPRCATENPHGCPEQRDCAPELRTILPKSA